MKISKGKIADYIISAFILVLALVMTILETSNVFKLCFNPFFMFLLVLSTGFGIMQFVKALMFKSPFRFMLSAILLVYAFAYSLIDFAHLLWWLVILCSIVFLFLVIITSIFVSGNKTEEIALNAKPDYKDYKQRKAEELENEKNNPKPQEELPKIKSFEEVNHPERKQNDK